MSKTPEQLAYDLFLSVVQQKQEALDELAAQMKKEGKLPHEFLITDNWGEVVKGLDQNKLIPYHCNYLSKLAANTILNTGETTV